MTARVEWRRAWATTVVHAIVDGDTLTLCGRGTDGLFVERNREAIPEMGCQDCRAIVVELAVGLGVEDGELPDVLGQDGHVSEVGREPEVVDLVAALRASIEAAKARRAGGQDGQVTVR